jgi:hypothetical protein
MGVGPEAMTSIPDESSFRGYARLLAVERKLKTLLLFYRRVMINRGGTRLGPCAVDTNYC